MIAPAEPIDNPSGIRAAGSPAQRVVDGQVTQTDVAALRRHGDAIAGGPPRYVWPGRSLPVRRSSAEPLMHGDRIRLVRCEGVSENVPGNPPATLAKPPVTADCVITTDPAGLIRTWNDCAEELFGHRSEDVIGRPWNLLLAGDDALVEEIARESRHGRSVHDRRVVIRARSGARYGASFTAVPISTMGIVSSIVIVIRPDWRARREGFEARRLVAIVDTSDDAIVAKDLDGIVTTWNVAAERMFGFTEVEMVGQSIRRIIPADRQGEEDEVLARIRSGEKVDHFETVRQRKDGTLVPISLTVSPIRDESGTVVGASKIARDISERKRSDEDRARLSALAARNASITEKLNHVGTVVASTLDREAVVQAVTDAATELTTAQFGAFFYNVVNERGEEYTLYTISGVPREAFSNFPMPRNTAVFDPTFKGTAIVRSDDITRDPRYGRNAPYHGQPPGPLPARRYLAAPARSNTGIVLGGLFFGHPEVGIFTQEHEDLAVGIAAWASVALENARLYRTLQDSNRLKDEFLATLSHELRTPLNAILGYARMLRSGMLGDDKRPRAIETIERNAESLTQIVEDVLDVSRIIAGKMRLNVQSVEPAEVIRRAIDAVQPTADLKGITVQSVLDPNAGPIAGDPERIQQITWNLLSNAIKFTPRRGKVQVHLQRLHSSIAIVVSDTGIGIAAEFLPHLFERFRQAEGGAARTHGGLGLGLSIVRQRVEMHGGTITGASDGVGKGATFTVMLPIMVARAQMAPDPTHTRASERYLATHLPDLTGVSVLAVDDDADALAMVRDILEAAGATVTTAASAEHALKELAKVRPQVLVADLGMPGIDGFDLISRIRRSDDASINKIPAAALTAYARSEERTRALRAGFQMHLAKPINPAELVESIRTLSRSRG